MKKFSHPVVVTYMVAITLAFLLALTGHAQSAPRNVIRNGKTFIERVDSTHVRQEPQMTPYKYQKGDSVWDIYVSSNGRAFIIRHSKRTGKAYRQYLPIVTSYLSILNGNDTSRCNR